MHSPFEVARGLSCNIPHGLADKKHIYYNANVHACGYVHMKVRRVISVHVNMGMYNQVHVCMCMSVCVHVGAMGMAYLISAALDGST